MSYQESQSRLCQTSRLRVLGKKPGLVVSSWLGQKAHIQEDVGLKPAVYWMNVSNASYYICNEKGNKGSQKGHTKKKRIKINETVKMLVFEVSRFS
jgi:hypothetical protein